MRLCILKFAGVILWSLFLFIPFIAQADEGFDVYMPLDLETVSEQRETGPFSFGGYVLRLNNYHLNADPGNKWSLKFKAGKDTVLSNDLAPEIRHDRLPLDDGERESFRFGIGLNYKF